MTLPYQKCLGLGKATLEAAVRQDLVAIVHCVTSRLMEEWQCQEEAKWSRAGRNLHLCQAKVTPLSPMSGSCIQKYAGDARTNPTLAAEDERSDLGKLVL